MSSPSGGKKHIFSVSELFFRQKSNIPEKNPLSGIVFLNFCGILML